MKTVSILDLLKSGAHFGHQKSKRYPKMDKYIFGLQNGTHIINLEETIKALEGVSKFIKKLTADGGQILFIGTKRQAKLIIRENAEKCNMPYVIFRWIGGTFTNFKNIYKLPKKLMELEENKEKGAYEKNTKKEQLIIDREITKLKEMVEGIRNMEKLPAAVFVVDIKNESTAVEEANKMNIPVIAITDTNVNPDKVTYPIPANDDSVNTIKLITSVISEAILEAKKKQ
jgi:small subunit ribosomal protein S2